jgi:glutathione S-transferase
VSAYWQRLQERDGYRRAIAAQNRAGIEQGIARSTWRD